MLGGLAAFTLLTGSLSALIGSCLSVPLHQDVPIEGQYLMRFMYDAPPTASGNRVKRMVEPGRPGNPWRSVYCHRVRPVLDRLRQPSQFPPSGLDPFYTKFTHAYGIPVVSSDEVPDEALMRACYVVRFLLADRWIVRKAYYNMFGRFGVMGVDEVTRDIPEHSDMEAKMDWRARGLGATPGRPIGTGAEENLLCYTRDHELGPDRYEREDIALHEFAHSVHILGAKYAIKGFERRLKAQYEAMKAEGKWARTYAMENHQEYFAEGVQSWFNVNDRRDSPNGIHGPIGNRTALIAYDPGLVDLIKEVWPCDNTYIKRCPEPGVNPRVLERHQRLKKNCPVEGETSYDANTCNDLHNSCVDWSLRGFCESNRRWMERNCMWSCDIC